MHGQTNRQFSRGAYRPGLGPTQYGPTTPPIRSAHGTPSRVLAQSSGFMSGFGPDSYVGLQAWYDVSDTSSMVIDGSNRVQLLADKSGNSAVNVLALNGAAGNYASSPDSAAVSLTTKLSILVRCSLSSLSVSGGLVAKHNPTTTNRGYYFIWSNSGYLQFFSSPNGTTLNTYTGNVISGSLSALTIYWFRVDFDNDDGVNSTATLFYHADNGSNTPPVAGSAGWIAAGTPTNAVTTIFDNNAILAVGARSEGTTDNLNGTIRSALIYSGLYSASPTLAFDANFATAAKLATSFTESSSNAATVTINTTGRYGARICGARDLVNMTAAEQPVYLPWSGENYGWLNGVSGNYFSSPDSAALDITGDIDLRGWVALNDWTPATNNTIVSKWLASGDQRSYRLDVENTLGGRLRFVYSTTGALGGIVTVNSSVAPTVSDFGSLWVRVTRSSSSGDVIFYTSPDGSSWTQLGTTQSTAAGTIFSGTAQVEVGSNNTGSELLAGMVLRAQIYNGINGTLAFDFNPAAYTSGTTFLDSSSNAATITLNGGSVIVNRTQLYFDGTNDSLKAAAFALAQPEWVNFVGSQVTWSSGDYVIDGNTANSMAIAQTTSTPRISMSAGSLAAENSGWSLGSRNLIQAIFNGASSSLTVGQGTPTTGSAGVTSGNGLLIGSLGGTANYGNITLNEVAIYSFAPTDAQKTAWYLYALRKWGF